MASSGTLTSWKTTGTTSEGNSYAGAHYSFEWTSSVKSPGVTTVTWNLYSRGRTTSPAQLWHNIYVNTIVNGVTTNIYTGNFAASGYTVAQYSFKNQFRTSGTFDVTHAADGTGSFQVYFKFAAYAYLQYHENTETATLDSNQATFTLTLNANGGSGGPGSQTLTSGVATAISTTQPTRSGYAFRGWNTNTSGTGTMYQPGDKITITSNTTLYAAWGHRYYVAYNSNGATGGSVANTTHYYNVASALATNNYTREYTITYDGNGGTASIETATSKYSANGWNTSSSGTGTNYNNAQKVSTLNATKDATTTLYAKWSGGSILLPTATRQGYRLVGWNTNSSGTGTSFMAGTSIKPTSNMTLYAQWTAVSGLGANIIYIKIDDEWRVSTW